jgi:hydroxymethylglutaryl-CoA reductase (NADPH)
MSRVPGFRFHNIPDALAFTRWVDSQIDRLGRIAAQTSCHCQLSSLENIVEGNQVFLRLQFRTGEAAGQNMVTLATEAMCSFIAVRAPVKPVAAYVEANFSGDKKASTMSLHGVRGKRTVAEAFLPSTVTADVLGCSPGQLDDFYRVCAIGAAMSGSIGQQGHYANALAALYLALGQDRACVAESAVGITRMEARDGGLYACVTLPNLIVGSVGGGTGLPDQSQLLAGMQLPKENTARALAEITAGICLAGELSISASLAAGSFARAHRVLGRRRNQRGNC